MPDLTQMTWGQLGTLFDGPHATPRRIDEGPYFLNIASLKAGRLDLSQSDHISPEEFVKWTRRVTPQENDLLFSYETRLGEAALMPGGIDACLGRRMALLRPDPDVVDPRFLLYYYLSPTFQSTLQERVIHGATVDRIGLATMPSWPVQIPALPTQRAISRVLRVLDDKVAANTATVDLIAALAHARVQRASAGCSPVALSSITTAITRGITPRYTDGQGWIVLNQKCVRDQAVSLELARFMEPKPSAADRLLQAHDLLVNSTGLGTLGRTARWTSETETVAVDSHITIVRFDEQQVDPAFAGIAALPLDSQIELLAEGSTGQTELRRDLLGALTLRLPNLATQRFVGDQIRQQDSIVCALRHESALLRATRDELLPLLMSGRIAVRDAEKTAEAVT